MPQDSDIISNGGLDSRVFVIATTKYCIPGAAINALLKFLSVLFRVLGPHSTFIAHLAASMPTFVYCLNRHVNPTDISGVHCLHDGCAILLACPAQITS